MTTTATTTTYAPAWVCEDCYIAHHYGAREVDGHWYAGESDTPADREPLQRLNRYYQLADATDSDAGEGIRDFSYSQCDGCGSALGGNRYRLSIVEEATR